MNIPFLALSILIAYFIGSIPTAYIFGRMLKGLDIRKHGSGNMGATNAFRVLGKGPGSLVLLIDILKGIVPVTAVASAFGLHNPWSLVLIGVATVAGHNWTVFLCFKGGKGIATSLGILIGLAMQLPGLQPVLGLVVLVWVLVFVVGGYVSVASLTAAVALPVLMTVYNAPFVLIVMSIVLCLFIVFRHRPNINRLAQGQERRVNFPFKKR